MKPNLIYIPYVTNVETSGGIGKSKEAKYGDSLLNKNLNAYNARNGIALEYHAANFPRIKLDKIQIGKLVKMLQR